MNNQLTTVPRRYDHPPQPDPAPAWRPARRVGLLDRAALHLGVALITWGRRPVRRERPVVSRETLETRRSLERLHEEYQLWGADLTRLK